MSIFAPCDCTLPALSLSVFAPDCEYVLLKSRPFLHQFTPILLPALSNNCCPDIRVPSRPTVSEAYERGALGFLSTPQVLSVKLVACCSPPDASIAARN